METNAHCDVRHHSDRDQALSTERAFACVRVEMSGARGKFPSNHHKLTALMEEVGELANALLEHDRGNDTSEHVFQEAIQVAATALRLACEGDSHFPRYVPGESCYTEFRPCGHKGE